MAHNAVISMSGADEALQVVPPEALRAKADELHEDIAIRAYHLFEARGRKHGHDREDWLAAEAEFVDPVAIDVAEDDHGVVVRAVFPEDTVRDTIVSVEPWRVMIYSAAPPIAGSKQHSRRAFATLILPARVNPLKPEAAFAEGALEVRLGKVIHPDD